MSRKKIRFGEIANRITGFEIPIFGGGLSWNPSASDIAVARGLLTYLEDRRALYEPYSCETASYVVSSILEIRKRLTSDLEQINRESSLAQALIAMRAACRKFLQDVDNVDDIELISPRFNRLWDRDEKNFFMALGELRSTIGVHAAQIAVRYGIDVEETFVSIFPALPDED